jgi:hypothetical protein
MNSSRTNSRVKLLKLTELSGTVRHLLTMESESVPETPVDFN